MEISIRYTKTRETLGPLLDFLASINEQLKAEDTLHD